MLFTIHTMDIEGKVSIEGNTFTSHKILYFFVDIDCVINKKREKTQSIISLKNIIRKRTPTIFVKIER